MKWLVVVALAWAGCVSGIRSQGVHYDDGGHVLSGVFTVSLCDVCSGPFDWQRAEAEKAIAAKCGSSFKIVEEGTQLSGSYEGWATPVGKGFVGGAMAQHDYFYGFKCVTPRA